LNIFTTRERPLSHVTEGTPEVQTDLPDKETANLLQVLLRIIVDNQESNTPVEVRCNTVSLLETILVIAKKGTKLRLLSLERMKTTINNNICFQPILMITIP
jgi:hypothetical protein